MLRTQQRVGSLSYGQQNFVSTKPPFIYQRNVSANKASSLQPLVLTEHGLNIDSQRGVFKLDNRDDYILKENNGCVSWRRLNGETSNEGDFRFIMFYDDVNSKYDIYAVDLLDEVDSTYANNFDPNNQAPVNQRVKGPVPGRFPNRSATVVGQWRVVEV
jgi:hypothetical protein